MSNKDRYDDIIKLPHNISKKHPQMSIYDRSAQFAPFAALTGYDDEIKEAQRLTDKRKDMDEELKLNLDRKLKVIQNKINSNPKITFEYFIPDKNKKDGKYIKITGNVKKIDIYNKKIIMANMEEIPVNEIVQITGNIFD